MEKVLDSEQLAAHELEGAQHSTCLHKGQELPKICYIAMGCSYEYIITEI